MDSGWISAMSSIADTCASLERLRSGDSQKRRLPPIQMGQRPIGKTGDTSAAPKPSLSNVGGFNLTGTIMR